MTPVRKTTAGLLESHRPLWRVVTRNPFVAGVRDGSLPIDAFDRWLVQDRHFVTALFSSVSRVLASAPPRDRGVLLDCLRAILGNIEWFEGVAVTRGLNLRAPAKTVCRAYMDYTLALGFESYTVGIVALWTQYRAYHDAWASARPGAPKFRKVIREWYSPAFKQLLRRITRAAESALVEATAREIRRAEEAFVEVAKYELAVWVMALTEIDRV